eukprot:SAG31_NODE_5071_length_2761_cov_4.024793_4_plen_70_part_00
MVTPLYFKLVIESTTYYLIVKSPSHSLPHSLPMRHARDHAFALINLGLSESVTASLARPAGLRSVRSWS